MAETWNVSGDQPDSELPDNQRHVGEVIGGQFKITSHLDSGGFSDVYLAFNLKLPEQRVVVKYLKDRGAAFRLESEARILSTLQHPNICGIIDYLPSEALIIIPYLAGESLQSRLERVSKLPPEQFLEIARALADALAYAHSRKTAHRDIKPSNVMLGDAGHAYLIDFGIAVDLSRDSARTRQNPMTIEFAAPERFHSHDYDPKLSDIYEFGATLYYTITKKVPYRDFEGQKGEIGPADSVLHPRLRRILSIATSQKPENRYSTVADLLTALQSLTVSQVYSTKRPAYWGIAGAAVLVIAALMYSLWPPPEPIPDSGGIGYDSLSVTVPTDSQSFGASELSTKPEGKDQLLNFAPVSDKRVIAGETVVFSVSVDPDSQNEVTLNMSAPSLPDAQFTDLGSGVGRFICTPDSADIGVHELLFLATAGSNTAELHTKIDVRTRPTAISSQIERTILQACNLTVNVDPEENSILKVDGKEYPIGSAIVLNQGRYQLQIENPDFPILRDTLDLTTSRTIKRLLVAGKPVRLWIFRDKRLQNETVVKLKLNGQEQQLAFNAEEIPYVNKLAGLYRLEIGVFDKNSQQIPIDSIYFIVGVDTLRLYETDFEIDLARPAWSGANKIDIKIF